MVDFAASIATAQRLITENGRLVTLVSLDDTPAVAAQPWKGAADPRATPDATLPVRAVFVPPSSASALGLRIDTNDLVKRAEQIAIVSPGGAVDTEIYDEIADSDGSRWKIVFSENLKPAELLVLSFFGVAR